MTISSSLTGVSSEFKRLLYTNYKWTRMDLNWDVESTIHR